MSNHEQNTSQNPQVEHTTGNGTSVQELRNTLRVMILKGEIPPGAILSQVQLAEQLHTSRTPLREALRMLQAEGMIVAEENRRVQVPKFEAQDLDSVYANRIILETLGIALTVPLLSEADFEKISAALAELSNAAQQNDLFAWEEAHNRYHALLVMHAGVELTRTLARYVDQSARFRLLYVQQEPRGVTVRPAAREEHEKIFMACRGRDRDTAVVELARHLARTALTLIAQLAPEYEPRAVRTALELVTEARKTQPRDSNPNA
ncbi:MAG: GntR family transcriptional regulator [Chloroflexi bacterium]|nr:GntR family transcriptional regulator [Chloroflexota bacterium]